MDAHGAELMVYGSSHMHHGVAKGHRYEKMIPERIVAATRQGDGAQLTRVQAEAIGAMRLIQLVGLEVEKLASVSRLVEAATAITLSSW